MVLINIVVEHPVGQPKIDREWLRDHDLQSVITVSITEQATGDVVVLSQGSTSGTSPTMGTRYVQEPLDPGEYVLNIRVDLYSDMFDRQFRFSC